MEKRKELFTGSTDKNANIKVHVNSLKDSSRADTATSIGVQINNSPKRGVYIDVVDGQSLLNVSVPVKERNLSLKVSGVFDDQTKRLEILDYSFNHSDDVFPKHVVKLKVSGVKKIGEIMQNHIEELSVCVDNVEKKYGATSIEVSSGCLEFKFQHKSEQSARAMVSDQKQIEGMFEEFVKSCGQEGDVSVQATYEIVEGREQEALAQRKERTHSQSQATRSDTGASSGKIITLEQEAHAQRKDKTHSQSQTTGSDAGASSGRIITLDLEENLYEEFVPKVELKAHAQRKERTHSKSQRTGSDTEAIEMEATLQRKDGTRSQLSSAGPSSGRKRKADLEDEVGPLPFFTPGFLVPDLLHQDKITRWLSALRNSGGGKLHLNFPRYAFGPRRTILEYCLEQCLLDDEFQDDVFDITFNKENHITIDAKPSHELITSKFNTKVKTVVSLKEPTKSTMVALLRRRRKETPAQLKGIDWDIRPGNSVHFMPAWHHGHSDLSDVAKHVFEDRRLREYISAMSKSTNGGSYFLGIDTNEAFEETSYSIKGLQLRSSGQALALSKELQKLVDKTLLVFDLGSWEFKSPPPDLIQCEVHENRSCEYVIEVAVRPFDGVVFYERHGPEAYKLDDEDELVRLTLDQWISEMTT